MAKILNILVFTLMPLLVMGQKSISDWINYEQKQCSGINTIKLFTLNNDKKILIEKITLNNKGLILTYEKYSNLFNNSVDNIIKETFEYDASDTLLISRRYEDGNTLQLFKYTYEYDSLGRLSSKGTKNSTNNEYESEYYYYNDLGLVSTKRDNFYNEAKDSISYYIDWIYTYDKSGNQIRESFAPKGVVKNEQIYTYDSMNNLIRYHTEGIHQCGDFIERYQITYNSNSKMILKEIWHASGDNWAFDFQYDSNGKLIKETKKTKRIKQKYRVFKFSDLPPLPTYYTQDMLEKNYSDEYEYTYFYDSKDRLIKVTETHLEYKISTDYILEYE